MSTVEPDKLYSFAAACKFIPSNRGETICQETLHAWRKAGRIVAECRDVMGRKQWFIRGSEILRVCLPQPEPVPSGSMQTPAALERLNREAETYLRRHGIL